MNRKSDEQRRQALLMEGKTLFMDELKKQLPALTMLLQRFSNSPSLEDAEEMYRVVHTLKGSAPTFGLERIGKVAEEMVLDWEWTQSATDEERAFFLLKAEQYVKKSERLLHILAMEYEVSRKELELDSTGQLQQFPKEFTLGRILLVDDDDVLRSYLVRRLTLDRYEVAEASCVQIAQKMLWAESYDLIILDLLMHPESGYELFAFLKESPTLKWLPLIVLSGKEELEDKVRCFRLGADDYVTKPFHYEELEVRINNLLMRTKHYEQMAFLDPLTGVYNRRYFLNRLTAEMERVRRKSGKVSLAFLDVDYFKRINDTSGHHAGDLVLQGFTHMLMERLRSTDVLARYGGEEFVVMFPDTTGDEATAIVTELLDQARTFPVASMEGENYSVTFSAGVIEWRAEWSVEEWIQLGDEAMYLAKQQGRNQVVQSDGNPRSRSMGDAVQNAVSRRKCVLVADDDAIIRSMLVSRLRNFPIEVIEATDGEQAMASLKSGRIDLCILDGVMPKLDGFSLLAKIKQNEQLKKVKVMMLSGRKHEEDVVRGLMLGADEYMAKPFSLVELEIRVKRLLEMK